MKVPITAFRVASLSKVVPEARRRAAQNADAETALMGLVFFCLLALVPLLKL